MEIIWRFGADKRKAKLLEEANKENNELKEQIKNLKLELVFQQNEIRKLKRRNTYIEKKVGKQNDSTKQTRINT